MDRSHLNVLETKKRKKKNHRNGAVKVKLRPITRSQVEEEGTGSTTLCEGNANDANSDRKQREQRDSVHSECEWKEKEERIAALEEKVKDYEEMYKEAMRINNKYTVQIDECLEFRTKYLELKQKQTGDLKERDQRLNDWNTKYQQLVDEHNDLEEELNGANEVSNSLSQRLEQREEALRDQKKQTDALLAEKEELEGQLTASKVLNEEQESRCKILEDKLTATEETVKKSNATQSVMERKLEEQELLTAELRKKCDEAVQRNTELEAMCDELSGKVTGLSEDAMKTKDEHQELQRLFQGMSDQNTEFQAQIKEMKVTKDVLTSQLTECRQQQTEAKESFDAENDALKQSLEELDVKYREIERKAEEEVAVSDQLREQIKKISKTANKSKKTNIKLRKKMETAEKKVEQLEYELSESQRKSTKQEEQLKEYGMEQRKYAEAITQQRALQHEVQEYIVDVAELKKEIDRLEKEKDVLLHHQEDCRRQSRRDAETVKRLRECREELVMLMQKCEDIISQRAGAYLPVAVLNAQDLELTDSEEDNSRNALLVPLVTAEEDDVTDHEVDGDVHRGNEVEDDMERNGKEVVYFNDSGSDDEFGHNKIIGKGRGRRRGPMTREEKEVDEISKVDREKDIAALEMGGRLNIQITVLVERLAELDQSVRTGKVMLEEKEEEVTRYMFVLRQLAIRRQLQEQVKKELVKREQNMVSMPSMRGVAVRHKTSLANLTQRQDEIDRIVKDIEQNDASWQNNIAMQLSAGTLTRDLLVSPSSASPTEQIRGNKGFLSESDLMETQSVKSAKSSSSCNSKKSHHSTKSMSTNQLLNRKRKQRNQRSSTVSMESMQRLQRSATAGAVSSTEIQSTPPARMGSWASSWFKN